MNYQEATSALIRAFATHARIGAISDIDKVTKGEILALSFLSLTDGSQLPSELSQRMGNSAARTAAILGSLENKGYVTRAIDKSNRRQILVSITDSGREHANRETGKMVTCVERILREMGESDTREFLRLTQKFFDTYSKIKQEVEK